MDGMWKTGVKFAVNVMKHETAIGMNCPETYETCCGRSCMAWVGQKDKDGYCSRMIHPHMDLKEEETP